jgi:hypothetical protein
MGSSFAFQQTFPFPTSSKNTLESASPTSAPATSSWASPSARASSSVSAIRLLASLVLGLRCVVDEQSVEREGVGEDEVADGRASDVHGVEGDGVLTLGGHLDGT